jgi:hypothetical protein
VVCNLRDRQGTLDSPITRRCQWRVALWTFSERRIPEELAQREVVDQAQPPCRCCGAAFRSKQKCNSELRRLITQDAVQADDMAAILPARALAGKVVAVYRADTDHTGEDTPGLYRRRAPVAVGLSARGGPRVGFTNRPSTASGTARSEECVRPPDQGPLSR